MGLCGGLDYKMVIPSTCMISSVNKDPSHQISCQSLICVCVCVVLLTQLALLSLLDIKLVDITTLPFVK